MRNTINMVKEQQEPKLTAYCSQAKSLLDAFISGKDIYATIASIAYNIPYEQCLEFHPETHDYQPDGKKRRSTGKILVLGINYGMSVESIGQDLFAAEKDMPDEEKTKKAQEIFDAVMKGFPELKNAILGCQKMARELGYTETILGRRRHHPNMQLPEFEFKAEKGYINPDVDPLDPSTLKNKAEIPERIVKQLQKEFSSYKYYGQIVKRTKQLKDEGIRVINNRSKIAEASRQTWNAIVQGSAADLTKMAILKLCNDPEWIKIGGRLLCPVHDELIVEVPEEFKDEGEEILARCMCEAGSFMPFKLTCDVTTTYRWYGLETNAFDTYEKPDNLDNLSESNIKWIQACMFENEYILPVYKEADGSKPRGDAAHGVNGVWSDELAAAIADYRSTYQIKTDEEFIEHINNKVRRGIL